MATTTRNGHDLYTEIGASGLRQVGGFVREEPLRELQGPKWQHVLREMVYNDPVIGALLLAIELLLRQVEWHVAPPDEAQDAAAAVEQATFVEQCREDMSAAWPDVLSEILTFLPWGFSPLEVVYKVRRGDQTAPDRASSKYNDGRIGWRKWALRAQESLFKWDFDDTGGVQAMEQLPAPDYSLRVIPIERLLLFRTTTRKGNPEGASILRSCYTSWYYKTQIQRIEGIGIERDLAGLPVGYVPPELLDTANRTAAQTDLFNALCNVLRNVRRDEQEFLLWPLAYDADGKEVYRFELASTGGRRQFDTDQIIARYDQRIALSVLADFLLLGSRQVGSFALAVDKTDLFTTALKAWLDSIVGVVNRHAIPRLIRLNGWPVTQTPELRYGSIDRVDVAGFATAVSDLVKVGALTPGPDLEAKVREVMKLPALPPEPAAADEAPSDATPEPAGTAAAASAGYRGEA